MGRHVQPAVQAGTLGARGFGAEDLRSAVCLSRDGCDTA